MTTSPLTMYMNSMFTDDSKDVNGVEMYPTKTDAFIAHNNPRVPPLILSVHMELPMSFRKREETNLLLDTLATAWKNNPNLRLGQFLYIINPCASTFPLISDKRNLEALLASGYMDSDMHRGEHDKETREAEIDTIIRLLKEHFNDRENPSESVYLNQLVAKIADEADLPLFVVLDAVVIDYLEGR